MGILREPSAWFVILAILLLFGAKRLPEAARGLGRSIRIFKAETEELRSHDERHDVGTCSDI